MYKVVEKFVSINGEGAWAGELTVFIRFAHCNLRCSYCDTMWANEVEVDYELLDAEEIVNYLRGTGVKRVTLTGGEPLLVKGMKKLLVEILNETDLSIEIETNGSVDIKEFILSERISFTLDYKGHSSGMEDKMLFENYIHIRESDTVKFVVGSETDLERAKNIIERYSLLNRTRVYFSPSYEKVEAREIVDFMMVNKLNKVKLQLQLHKHIWDPNQKGV